MTINAIALDVYLIFCETDPESFWTWKTDRFRARTVHGPGEKTKLVVVQVELLLVLEQVACKARLGSMGGLQTSVHSRIPSRGARTIFSLISRTRFS